jgi:hypothetical protein
MASAGAVRKYAVLVADQLPYLQGEQYKALLASPDEPEEWSEFHVVDGKFPMEPNDFTGFVITGSRADAHADTAWIVELKAFCGRGTCLCSFRALQYCTFVTSEVHYHSQHTRADKNS